MDALAAGALHDGSRLPDLASQGTPGVIVEHGDTKAMFASPQDQRTHDYVNGRFG